MVGTVAVVVLLQRAMSSVALVRLLATSMLPLHRRWGTASACLCDKSRGDSKHSEHEYIGKHQMSSRPHDEQTTRTDNCFAT